MSQRVSGQGRGEAAVPRDKRERVTPRLSCEAPVTMSRSGDGEGKSPTRLRGWTSDVSLEGALVLLPERVPPGSRVTLAFSPSAPGQATERSLLETAAAIRWVRETPRGFQHGLRFLCPEVELLLRAWPGRVIQD